MSRRSMMRLATAGFTLVELMVAMLLGLIIVGAVGSVFMANRQAYGLTENLSRIQENTRVSFELMAREIREAGGTPCGADVPVANVVNGAAAAWWGDLGVRGFEEDQVFPLASTGVGPANRAAGTDAIYMTSAREGDVSVVSHNVSANVSAARLQVSTQNHSFRPGDVVMVCDFQQASVFQVTGAQPGVIVHATGVPGVAPGNCTKGLGFPVECTTNGNPKQYTQNSTVIRYVAAGWYVGCNGRVACNLPGGRSLYRAQLQNTSGALVVAAQELIDGVQDMQLQFMERGSANYVNANMVGDWRAVTAIRLTLALLGPDEGVTTSADRSDRLTRQMTHVVALRNRVP